MSFRSGWAGGSAAAALVAASLLTSDEALAGAWTLEKGKGQVIVTGLYSQASEAFADEGVPVARPDFAKGALDVFAEYGLWDGFTLVGKTEMGSERNGNLPFAQPALSSAELGGRLRLWQGAGAVVSTAVSARFEEAWETTAARPSAGPARKSRAGFSPATASPPARGCGTFPPSSTRKPPIGPAPARGPTRSSSI